MPIHTSHIQKWCKISVPWEEILVLYNEVMMKIVHKEVSRVPSGCLGQPRLFEPAPLVQQISLGVSLKRHLWQLSMTGMS